MKKIGLTFLLCIFAAGTSFAQNNMEAMRFLTINALVQYGQKLYDRGDLDEACAVFNHVLSYDGHQAQALEYLKQMGHAPLPEPVLIVKPKVVVLLAAVKNSIVAQKPDVPSLGTVDVSNEAALREAIETQKQVIKKLRDQISKLRMNIVSESTQQ